MKKSTATLRDVAERAGVHFSTASRAVNPDTRQLVNADLAEKILRIADELGYRPNQSAVSLKMRRSFLLNVLLPDIANPFFPPIVTGIRRRLEHTRFIAIVGDAERPAGQERLSVKVMKMRPLGGVIVATAKLKDPLVDEALREGLPVVQVNRVTTERLCSTVTNDDMLGMRLIVEHLKSLGHQRLAHVAGPQNVSTGVRRREGFSLAARELGLAEGAIAVAERYAIEAGRAAMEQLLAKRRTFTAVVAANDLLALGCIDALKARGLSCPRDISVTGVGDIPLIDRMVPALTTVRIDGARMGWFAADLMVKAIEDAEAPSMHLSVDPALVVRDSTAPVAAAEYPAAASI